MGGWTVSVSSGRRGPAHWSDMLDLAFFAEPLTPADTRLRVDSGVPIPPVLSPRRGVRWWLVREDVEPDDVLPNLINAMRSGGWHRLAAEKMSLLIGSDHGKVVISVDDAPCRTVIQRTLNGQERRGPRWPEAFDERVIVRVEVI